MNSPLSPLTQKIWDASNEANSFYDEERGRLAAAFRELVAQCAVKRSINPDRLGTEMIIEAEDVIAIAKELEGES